MNDPDLEKAVLGLWLCRDGLRDFQDGHTGGGLSDGATGDEPPCLCVTCQFTAVAEALADRALALVESCLSGYRREMRRLRGRRLPSVYELTNAIAGIERADDGNDADELDDDA